MLPHLDLNDFTRRKVVFWRQVARAFSKCPPFSGGQGGRCWRQGGTLNDDFLVCRKSKVVSNQQIHAFRRNHNFHQGGEGTPSGRVKQIFINVCLDFRSPSPEFLYVCMLYKCVEDDTHCICIYPINEINRIYPIQPIQQIEPKN